MKIGPNGASGVYRSGNEIESRKEQPKKAGQAAKNVDSIQISGARERTTAQLVDSLKSQIMKDVRAGIDSHRLEDLREEIASGGYDASPADIVHRIIGQD